MEYDQEYEDEKARQRGIARANRELQEEQKRMQLEELGKKQRSQFFGGSGRATNKSYDEGYNDTHLREREQYHLKHGAKPAQATSKAQRDVRVHKVKNFAYGFAMGTRQSLGGGFREVPSKKQRRQEHKAIFGW